MSALLTLIKGFPGKPSHAPLTDVSVGAYTVGVAALIAGALGFEEEATAKAALLAISVGLIVAVPTSLTGLLDWADISKGTAKRKLANYHLLVMVTATTVFALTWLAQRPGYDDGEVTTLGLLLGIGAFGLLILGGTLGGALAYVYGVRVVKKDVSLADALIPGRISETSSGRAANSGPVATQPAGRDAQYTPSAGRDAQYTPQAAAPASDPDPADPVAAAVAAARYRL